MAGLSSASVRLRLIAWVAAAGGSVASSLWTAPTVVASAFLVAWGAEAAQFVISQGLALALLAWLQTLPEFAVEAAIAWDAGRDPARLHFAIANLTGAIRLLLGFGWPVIFFVCAFARWREGRRGSPLAPIRLARDHAVEVLGLIPGLLYWVLILWKGSATVLDAIILLALYGIYLWVLTGHPPHDTEQLTEAPPVARWAVRQRGWRRPAAIGGLFAVGGTVLFVCAHPLVESLLGVALLLGVSQFFFIQWVAPVLSEFPELVSTVNWARRVTHAPMALMNLVSSNINQWTVLAAMIPVVYGYSHWQHHGTWAPFPIDAGQSVEIRLTLLQTALGVMILLSMRFGALAAATLLALWIVEVAVPSARGMVAIVYSIWMAILTIGYAVRPQYLKAPRDFWETLRARTRSAGLH